MCLCLLAQCLLRMSAFTLLTSRCWKHVWVFCGVWCWHLGKASLWGSTALWNDLRLEVAEASGDGQPLTPPGETWHLQWVVFVGQKGGFIHSAERTCWHRSSTSEMASLGKMFIFCNSRKPENGLWFHSQHFDKMPQNKGYWEIFTSYFFCCSPNLLNEASDSQFSACGPNQDGVALGKPSRHHGTLKPPEGISSTDIVWQEVKCRGALFFKKLLNSVIKLVLRTSVALFWDFIRLSLHTWT